MSRSASLCRRSHLKSACRTRTKNALPLHRKSFVSFMVNESNENQMYSKVGNQGLVLKMLKRMKKSLGIQEISEQSFGQHAHKGIRTENTTVPAAAPAVRKVLETCYVLEFRMSSNNLSGLICQRPNQTDSIRQHPTAPPCLLASTDLCKAPIDRTIQIHLKGLGRKLVTRPPDHLLHLSNLYKDSCS